MTEDLQLLARSLREAFGDLSPSAEVRRLMATEQGWEPAAWQRLCTELGLVGLAVPEALGGGGFTTVELGVAFEEAGRVLLCAPLFSTAALALPLLLRLGDRDALDRYVPGLCAGSLVATVVTADDAGRVAPPGAAVRAVADGDGWRLDGVGGFVVDGAFADLVLLPASGADGLGVFAVEAGAPGLEVAPLVTLDQTRKQARLRFEGTRARRVGPPDASTELGAALDVARAMLACEQVGGAQRCLDMTVAHARTRVQFGRAIGSFQAVKQKAADMLIRVESARSAAQTAAAAAAGDDLAVTAAVAKAYCSEAYTAVAAETIQLHGGIGFTWEHDAHLYFKRARTGEELLGTPAEHLDRLARHLETV